MRVNLLLRFKILIRKSFSQTILPSKKYFFRKIWPISSWWFWYGNNNRFERSSFLTRFKLCWLVNVFENFHAENRVRKNRNPVLPCLETSPNSHRQTRQTMTNEQFNIHTQGPRSDTNQTD